MFSKRFLQHSLAISHRSFSSTNQIMARRKPSAGKRPTSEFDIEFLPEYQFDSMTKPGYEILLAQAEIRKYLRKVKYELPQLESKYGFQMLSFKAITINNYDYYLL